MLVIPSLVRHAAALAITFCVPLVAAPAINQLQGIPNFQGVNDQVYRGGQPSEQGFHNLAAAGFKTIVDLREDDPRGKDEKKLVKALGMRYVNVPMKGMKTPSDKQIVRALKVLGDDKSAPVFVHCKRGADRTGVVVACYRMEHDHWGRQQSLQEARDLGMSWYQFPLIRYVLSYHPHAAGNGLSDGVDSATEAVRGFGEDAVGSLKHATRSVTGIFK
jgi:tyrosine-protein phosphatase SIW14